MLTRRKLLTASIQGCLLIGAASLLPACGSDSTGTAASTTDALIEYAQNMAAISDVGPRCVRTLTAAGGDDRDALAHRLAAELSDRLGSELAADAVGPALDAAIRGDFEADRVLDVNGWQLSETECRLAALAAVQQGMDEPMAPAAAKIAAAQFVEVTDWGPKSTIQGETFNEQPDGHSGIWIRAEDAPASTVVVFAGHTLSTQVYPQSLTSGLRGEFMHRILDAPGAYEVELLDQARQLKQPLGEFKVIPAPTLGPDGEVTRCSFEGWGPQYGYAGEAFNEQPDGRSAFWVRTRDCALPDSRLLLDGKALKTTVRDGLLTAGVPWGHELEPGLHDLEIVPGDGETQFKVGAFRVEP